MLPLGSFGGSYHLVIVVSRILFRANSKHSNARRVCPGVIIFSHGAAGAVNSSFYPF